MLNYTVYITVIVCNTTDYTQSKCPWNNILSYFSQPTQILLSPNVHESAKFKPQSRPIHNSPYTNTIFSKFVLLVISLSPHCMLSEYYQVTIFDEMAKSITLMK